MGAKGKLWVDQASLQVYPTAVQVDIKQAGVVDSPPSRRLVELALTNHADQARRLQVLVFALAPLVTEDRRLQTGYIGFSLLALIADMYKWPIENFPVALILMLSVYVLLIATMVAAHRQDKAAAPAYLQAAASRRPISGG